MPGWLFQQTTSTSFTMFNSQIVLTLGLIYEVESINEPIDQPINQSIRGIINTMQLRRFWAYETAISENEVFREISEPEQNEATAQFSTHIT
jgi:hypothetical protein